MANDGLISNLDIFVCVHMPLVIFLLLLFLHKTSVVYTEYTKSTTLIYCLLYVFLCLVDLFAFTLSFIHVN